MRLLLLFILSFSLVAQIPGTFRVTGPVAPPATNSNFGATLPVYGTGGLLTGLSSLTQLQDTNRYPVARRHAGQVARLTNGAEYTLGSDLLSWYNSGSVSNLAALRAIEPATAGGVVSVDSYSTSGDSGGGFYTLSSSTTGTNTYGGKITALGGSMSWQFMPIANTISSAQFGIFSSSSNLVQIQTWIDYGSSLLLKNLILPGEYGLTNSLILRNNLYLVGPRTARILRMGSASQTNNHNFSTLKTSGTFNPYQTNNSNGREVTITTTNIYLGGFTIGTASGYFSGFSLSLFEAADCVTEKLTLETSTNHWAITGFGNNLRFLNNQIFNGGAVFQDGIHILGGDGILIANNYIESGDDSIALSPGSALTSDLVNVTVTGNYVSSSHAHSFRIYQENPSSTNYIANVSVDGLVGYGGLTRNGLIRIQSASTNTTYAITNVTFSGIHLTHGGIAGHGGAGVGSAWGIYAENADKISFSKTSVANTPWQNFYFKNCGSVTLDDCEGWGAQDTFFNGTGYFENTKTVQISGGQFRNGNLKDADTLWFKGVGSVILNGSYIENGITNKGSVLVFDGVTGSEFIATGNVITNSVGSGIKLITEPSRIVITGNSIWATSISTNGFPVQYATGTKPPSAIVQNNFGYYVPSAEFSYAVTNSSGAVIGSLDAGLGNYLRIISTNGVITFAPNNATTNTSSTTRLAFNSAGASNPYLLAVGSDNGSFQTISFGFGSSFVAGARQLSFGTTATNYTAGTERIRLTTSGTRFQPDGITAAASSDAAVQIVSTNTGFRIPEITTAQRFSILLQGAGVRVWDTDFSRDFISLSSNTNSWRALGAQIVLSNQGDSNVTINPWHHNFVFPFSSTLTANRTVTLGTTGAVNGDTITVVRTGLGAFTLDVGGLKTIPSATAATVIVQYNGSAWTLIGYQLL